jgi:hypothetical protein
MKCYERIAAGVDVTPLLLELQRQPELWDKNPCRLSKRGPHHETQDIFLRYKDERPHIASGDWSGFSAEHIPDWYASIDRLPAARRLCFDLMARVGGEMLGGVFLYKVAPGKRIHPHSDPGWHPNFYDKFNVCIKSNETTAFAYPKVGEAFVQRAGDVHWFRNDEVHEIVNAGDDDHIVLTVCIRLDRGARVPWSPEGWTMDESKAMRQGGL